MRYFTPADGRKIQIKLPAPHEKQAIFCNWDIANPQAQVLVAPCGTKVGKAQVVSEMLPTTCGWKPIGEIGAGDFVFDEFGKAIEVLSVTEWMYNRTCYEVVFSDGNIVKADAAHLWKTQTHCERKNEARSKTIKDYYGIRTTEQIKDSLLHWSASKSRPNHSVDLVKGFVEFGEKLLPIDPYLLGVWLGDGTHTTGTITKADLDIEIVKELERRGEEVVRIPSSKYGRRVVGLTVRLREFGLLGNKHIPKKYLISSPKQRMDLLHGLMDTDGTARDDGFCCFDNTNKDLVDGVENLLNSFGVKTNRSIKQGRLNGLDKKLCYRVWFSTAIAVFKLERKLKRIQDVTKKSERRYIVAVREIPSEPVCCITVDSPTRLYLTGKAFIPTHNSFGGALWLAREALSAKNYCIWLAPSYLKCKIGYRYLKYFLDIPGHTHCVDGDLEIRLKNGSFIKFLHGKDAEVTVEGEAVDRFCIDESGKQSKQLWYSLFTTITQTRGKGIVTGTPRGFGWYYDVFRKAKSGDPFFVWAQLRTLDNPYVSAQAVEQAKRLLPPMLYNQYYEAMFVSGGAVFGDLSKMFTGEQVDSSSKFWIHPNPEARAIETVTGWDIAKQQDYSVFYTVNIKGEMVGYARFRRVPYEQQVDRLKIYFDKFFPGEKTLRYDATGVGNAVGEMITSKDLDVSIVPVIFSNRSKAEMVSRVIMSIESDWHKCPRIEQIEHEFASYEVNVTKSGLFSYSAPEGEHDDVVSAGMLAISGAFETSRTDEMDKALEDIFTDKPTVEDEFMSVSDEEQVFGIEDDFFDNDLNTDNFNDDFSFDT